MTALKRFTKYVLILSTLTGGLFAFGHALKIVSERLGGFGLVAFVIVLAAAVWTFLEWDLERAGSHPDPTDKIGLDP